MIAETMRNEAAKSLLERLDEKTKLVRFFRYNASAKHGVPIDPNREISFPETTAVVQPPAAQPVVQQPATQQPSISSNVELAAPASSSNDILKGILATLAAGAVIGGSILGGMAISKPAEKPAVQQSQEQAPYRESPFQYLEDQGEHLP